MGVLDAVSIDDIMKRGSIKDADVLKMRQALYEDGAISLDEADRIFTLNDACPIKDASWGDFFVEAITDAIIHQAEPQGYLTAANADWLIARISADGDVDSKTELDLLIHVLDEARWSPERLVSFALAQVKRAVVKGDGPLRSGQSLARGTITEVEVNLLRRIIFAFGGDGNVSVTRAEAEVFFDIEDAVGDGAVNPAWTDFFVKAMTNCLMATSGYAVPTREDALRREAWLDRRGDLSLGNFLSGMISASLSSIWSAYHDQSPEERALARLERQRIEIITNEQVTESEANWLAARMARDGKLTPTERALLEYLDKNAPNLHPSLRSLAQKFGVAA